MAEVVLGAVASGITVGALVAQVTSSVVKLKSYWDQVQNAPREIQDLLEEVETLRLVLAAIEDNQRRKVALISDPPHMLMCLRRCKQEVIQLQDLTDSLNTHLDAKSTVKRKWASTKVVMKKEMLEKCRMRLERAINMLSVSQQAYTMCLLHLQSCTVAGEISLAKTSTIAYKTEDRSLRSTPPSDAHTTEGTNFSIVQEQKCTSDGLPWTYSSLFGTIRYVYRRNTSTQIVKMNEPRANKQWEEIVFEYCAPAWLINRAWRLKVVKSCAGWTFCPRTYNTVSSESLVFQYAMKANVKGLQELFENREASPFDRNELEFSPLFYGAFSCDYATCHLLIEQGADGGEISIYRGCQISMLDYALYGCGKRIDLPTSPKKTVSYHDAIRLLQEHSLDLSLGRYLGRYLGSKEGFWLTQQVIDPDYYAKPLNERVRTAIKLASRLNGPATVRASIALGPLPPLTHTIKNDKGGSLLHAVAFQIGFTLVSIETRETRHFGSKQLESNLIGWRLLRKELIAQGSQLHCVSDFKTPLQALIHGLMRFPNTRQKPTLPMWGLVDWLECLHNAHIDLAEYGSKENDLYRQGFVIWKWTAESLKETPMREYTWDLKCLDYGPSPSDWKVTVDRWSESEAPFSSNVPGGWVDENEDDHEEADQD